MGIVKWVQAHSDNMSRIGNRSIAVQSSGEPQDERFPKHPENETSMSHSTGGGARV